MMLSLAFHRAVAHGVKMHPRSNVNMLPACKRTPRPLKAAQQLQGQAATPDGDDSRSRALTEAGIAAQRRRTLFLLNLKCGFLITAVTLLTFFTLYAPYVSINLRDGWITLGKFLLQRLGLHF